MKSAHQPTFEDYQQAFQRVDEVVARIERFQVQPDFPSAVTGRSKATTRLDLADDAILKMLVELIAYSNNAKSDTVKRVIRTGVFDTIFAHYDVQKAACLNPDRIVGEYWPRIKSIRFKYKIACMVGCAKCLLAIRSRHGSFMQYLNAQNIPVTIQTTADLDCFWKGFDAVKADFKQMNMPYLKNFTTLCHMFLELGYDCAKPDSAVMKTAVDLQIVPPSKRKNGTFPDRDYRQVVQFMQRYAMCRGIRVAVVDLYFLIHGGQRDAAKYVQSTYYHGGTI
jgi:3-methyladenine DNA glycosylase Tag